MRQDLDSLFQICEKDLGDTRSHEMRQRDAHNATAGPKFQDVDAGVREDVLEER